MEGLNLGTHSHSTILPAVVARTTGPVIECGMGWGSTPTLHYLCKNRKLVSADSDALWIGKFDGYAGPTHEIHQVAALKPIAKTSSGVNEMIEAWVEFCERIGRKYEPAVVFLDQAPGEARVPCAKVLKGYTRFIVVHDREADEPGSGGNYRWRDLDGLFKYQSIMKRIYPWTGVYSDVEEFRIEEVDARDGR